MRAEKYAYFVNYSCGCHDIYECGIIKYKIHPIKLSTEHREIKIAF